MFGYALEFIFGVDRIVRAQKKPVNLIYLFPS